MNHRQHIGRFSFSRGDMDAATQIKLEDLDFYAIGNEIDIWGVVYGGKDALYIMPLPTEDPEDLDRLTCKRLVMNEEEMARFFKQTDVLDVQGPQKIILRKSQRMVDQKIAWNVYKRDGYRCRYCGEEKPLTVDHVDLWEDGGSSTEANLISACRRCNKLRGSTPYAEWIDSDDYYHVSLYKPVPLEVRILNKAVALTIEDLKKLRGKVRSR